MKIKLLVEFELPAGATWSDARHYVETEIRAGCGAYRTDDPFYNLDRRSITVSFVPNEATTAALRSVRRRRKV